MPDETLTPVIREEEFLAAIAGDGEMPDPVIRKEEFLAAIGGRVDDLSDAVDALEDIVPTPAAVDSGKVLTAAEKTASQTIMPEYSATFDEYGHASPTNITVTPASIPEGTVGTLRIGETVYELSWTYNAGGDFGIFGELASGIPCLGYDGIEWYIDNGPLSQTVTVSMTAALPSGEIAAEWKDNAVVVTFSDTTTVMTAFTAAVTAALTSGDYLLHAGTGSTQAEITATSGVSAADFDNAVKRAIKNKLPIIVDIAGLGVLTSFFYGSREVGSTAQFSISSYNAGFGYVTAPFELYYLVDTQKLYINVYAQQIKFPAP